MFARAVEKTVLAGQTARYVGNGDLATANQTLEMKKTFEKTLRNANKNEGGFSITKMLYEAFPNVSAVCAGAVAAEIMNRVFGNIAQLYLRRKKEMVTPPKATAGMIEKWPREVILKTVEHTAIVEKKEFAKNRAAEVVAAKAAAVAKRTREKQEKLDAQTKRYADGMYVLEITAIVSGASVQARPLEQLTATLDALLKGLTSDNQRCIKLTDLIKRDDAMGHEELKPKHFGSEVDASIGKAGSPANAAFLRAAVLAAWTTIKERQLELRGEPVMRAQHARKMTVLEPGRSSARTSRRKGAAGGSCTPMRWRWKSNTKGLSAYRRVARVSAYRFSCDCTDQK